MDIAEFFQQSAGKWFSQRTEHFLAEKPTVSGKSDLYIEILAKDDPAVLRLCQHHGIDPSLAICGMQTRWEGTINGVVNKQKGAIVLVPVADSSTGLEGRLLRETNPAEKTTAVGRYALDDNDVLTLTIEDGTTYSEERLWYLNPNLRLRTSIVKQSGEFSQAFFCSEIRLGLTKPASA